MTTELGLDALRVAATLAHSLPGVRLRVRDGDRLLVDVRPHDDEGPAPDDAAGTGITTSPCGFRNAVVRAWRQHRAGVALRFVDLDPGRDPAIDVELPLSGRTYPGAVHRVTIGDLGTDVCLVHAEVGADLRLGEHLAVLEVFHEVVARVAVRQLLDDLAPAR